MRHPFDADNKGDPAMSAAFTTASGAKASVLDGKGRMLVFAPPLVTGFRGAPLALSLNHKTARNRQPMRRNIAKRRAYGA